MKKNVLTIIDLLYSTYGDYPPHSGGCYKFHLILLTIFENATGYYNGDHVITKIGRVYYDKDGVVDIENSIGQYVSFDTYGGYEYFEEIFEEYL